MNLLILHLSSLTSGEILTEWALYKKNVKVVSSFAPVPLEKIQEETAAHDLSHASIIAMIPSRHVLNITITVPRKQRRHIKNIIPFLVEPHIADNIADSHIVNTSFSTTTGELHLSVIRKTVLESYLKHLNISGVQPDILIAEPVPSPTAQNTWNVFYNTNMVWLHTGGNQTYCIESDALPILLKTLPPTSPLSIECTDCRDAQSFTDHTIMEAFGRAFPQANITQHLEKSVFDVFCNACNSTPALLNMQNLLQGDFRQNHKKTGNLAFVRNIGLILTFWFFVSILLSGTQAVYFYYQSRNYHEQEISLYRELFPHDTKIINPRQQMETHLTSNENHPKDFLSALQTIAKQWPQAQSTQIKIQSINYTGDNILTLSMKSQTIEQLNNLVEKLAASGIAAKMPSVVKSGSDFTAQLTIRGAE